MDWTSILSAAIGTAGGTSLTVIAAWLIYRSEKKNALENKQVDRAFNEALKIIDYIHSIHDDLHQMQSSMYKIKHSIHREFAVDSATQFDECGKSAKNLSDRLSTSAFILDNLKGYDDNGKLENFSKLVADCITNELSALKYDSVKAIDKTIEIEKVGFSIIEDLHIFIKENKRK